MSLPGGVAAGADDERSTGAPPRPGKIVRVLLFFLYFFVFVVGIPMLTVAVVQAKYGLIDGSSTSASPWGTKDGRFVDGRKVLGATQPVFDMRTMFPFAKAAALTSDWNGTIALAVATASAEDIRRAVGIIERQYQLTVPDQPNQKIGPEGFWHGYVLRDDRHLLVVLGRDQAAVDERIAAVAKLPKQHAQEARAPGDRIKTATKYGIFLWAALQFFVAGRVASWAGRAPAVPDVAPVAAETLMNRLLDLNKQDIPYTISRGKHANEIVIDWRYAEAKWLDLMRVHGMRKGYRLVFRFYEGEHNVRAQDRYASFDWSAGRGPNLLSLNWKVWLGITFYEYQHERVFGLQFKDGKPTFDLSYAYTFNLNEMKGPMIEIIRHAGWNFRPVVTFFRPVGG
jgi:hypothetical protein